MLHGAAWLLLVTACAHSPGPGTGTGSGAACTVIEREADVDACVGKTVTLRGVVSRTKIPTLLGVDVGEGEALADQPAEATGVLERYVEAEPAPDEPIAARRGAGTYYRLRGETGLAPARPVKR